MSASSRLEIFTTNYVLVIRDFVVIRSRSFLPPPPWWLQACSLEVVYLRFGNYLLLSVGSGVIICQTEMLFQFLCIYIAGNE